MEQPPSDAQWCDAGQSKQAWLELCAQLQRRAARSPDLRGFQLRGARLAGVDLSSLAQMLCFALLFFALGVRGADGEIGWSAAQDATTNWAEFGACLYYSVVTFTTLSYGDIVPLGWSRAVAALEAFVGSFTMALFVVVFVKKMTR